MRVSKRTERLIREAAVLAHVHGAMWGQANPRKLYSSGAGENYPRDSAVVYAVLRGARSNSDIYGALSKVDPETPYLLPPQWILDREREETEYLRGLMNP